MKVISSVSELQKEIKELLRTPVGFVPTMGALHEGHLSLVRNATNACPLVVVSIYVNPTQFNDKNDLKNYPRTIESDLELLSPVLRENDIVFTPGDIDIYPEEDKRVFDFGNLGQVMEAKLRPGHFNGVALVVSRLFDIVKPDYAYFGEKDFQQLAVVKELVRQTKDKVIIVGNPIVRENDGLAMSSRNRFLEPEIRKNANIIYSSLQSAAILFIIKDIPEIKEWINRNIEEINGFSLEYFEIVDDMELKPVESKKYMIPGIRYFGCIAVKAGSIRLIDNIEIPLF
jgi:pantoate--beta-alanine ligase